MRRQLDLLAATPISFDPGFADLRRSELADGAWSTTSRAGSAATISCSTTSSAR
jgi:hypothetical protein